MAGSVAKAAGRAHASTSRTDSRPARTGSHPLLDGVRAGSSILRADASHVSVEPPNWKALYAECVRTVMQRRGLSVKAAAIAAQCSETAFGEAINDREGRNLAGHWVLAQGQEFNDDVTEEFRRQMGWSIEAKRAVTFDALVELLRVIWFRERQSERGQ